MLCPFVPRQTEGALLLLRPDVLQRRLLTMRLELSESPSREAAAAMASLPGAAALLAASVPVGDAPEMARRIVDILRAIDGGVDLSGVVDSSGGSRGTTGSPARRAACGQTYYGIGGDLASPLKPDHWQTSEFISRPPKLGADDAPPTVYPFIPPAEHPLAVVQNPTAVSLPPGGGRRVLSPWHRAPAAESPSRRAHLEARQPDLSPSGRSALISGHDDAFGEPSSPSRRRRRSGYVCRAAHVTSELKESPPKKGVVRQWHDSGVEQFGERDDNGRLADVHRLRKFHGSYGHQVQLS